MMFGAGCTFEKEDLLSARPITITANPKAIKQIMK